MAPLPELPGVLLANGSRAVGSLRRDLSGTAPGFWIVGLLLLTLLLALAPLRYRGSLCSALLAAGLLLFAWAVAYGPQFALAQPVIDRPLYRHDQRGTL